MRTVIDELGISEGRDCSNFIRMDFQEKLDPSLALHYHAHPFVVSPDHIKQVSAKAVPGN